MTGKAPYLNKCEEEGNRLVGRGSDSTMFYFSATYYFFASKKFAEGHQALKAYIDAEYHEKTDTGHHGKINTKYHAKTEGRRKAKKRERTEELQLFNSSAAETMWGEVFGENGVLKGKNSIDVDWFKTSGDPLVTSKKLQRQKKVLNRYLLSKPAELVRARKLLWEGTMDITPPPSAGPAKKD